MPIKLSQHIPGFVDGATPKAIEAETQEELFSNPWLRSYQDDRWGMWAREVSATEGKKLGIEPEDYEYWQNGEKHIGSHCVERGTRKFHQFSLSDNMLMEERDEGRYWWVIGYITEGLEKLNLPKWEAKRD